jgi:hypothetical protein
MGKSAMIVAAGMPGFTTFSAICAKYGVTIEPPAS